MKENAWQDIPEYFFISPNDIKEKREQEEATRPQRIEQAFLAGANSQSLGEFQRVFNGMWLGLDSDRLNDQLISELKAELAALRQDDRNPGYRLYDLVHNVQLLSLYYTFTSGPNQLSPDARKVLLEVLWLRTRFKNDIALTRNSTWWMAGSENHDLNTKGANLVSSRIFMNEPDYADRIYPNYGYGDAYGYGEAGYYGKENVDRHGGGRAEWSDGNDYRPEDHYRAWLEYFKEYFRERVTRGFFLENGSPGYMKFTISYILLIYNFCGDAELRKEISMFLDLFWADWGVQQLGGLRGGPKTRHHKSIGGYDSMTVFARFYLGGPGETSFNYSQQLLSDYSWPEIVWELVLDREGLGCFSYLSRGIGEEEETMPRPLGTERTMMGNRESRFVKYSFVTPDYILGTQMDHPLAMHSHLSSVGRWQGLITADPNTRITTVALSDFRGKMDEHNEYNVEALFHSVQHNQVLITQQRRRWNQINPDWYPAYKACYEVPIGLHVGSGWDSIEEKEGWIFLQKDKAYAAVNILLLEKDPDPYADLLGTGKFQNTVVLSEESYTWERPETLLRLKDPFSPIIIEAGRQADFGSFDSFCEAILKNPPRIYRTMVTWDTFFIIVYKGVAKEAQEIVFNAANTNDIATIGGEYVNYAHGKVFDCPYIQSEYGSGIVTLHKDKRHVTLDFNHIAV